MLVRMPIEYDSEYQYLETWIDENLLYIKAIPKPQTNMLPVSFCLGDLEFSRLKQAVEFVEEQDA